MNFHEPTILDGTPQSPPWAAEHYQVQKYGTRYYADQKPPCALIADPHSEPVPGFSSLKPSKPFRKSVTVGDRKYTVPLDWYRAGEWFRDVPLLAEEFANGEGYAVGAFYNACHKQRDRDFARGHAIHAAAEAALVGQGVLNVNPDAAPYIPHLTEWIERNVTDVNAIEAVVFGDGYGGTGDAWVNVRGVSVYLDWKSRGADSAHGIYEEEIAQGGAYTSARYCIVPTDDRQSAVRAPLPPATYGLVLSIRPDGVEEFWYDLEDARAAFSMMKQAHTMTSSSGKLARAAKIKDPTSVQESAKRKTKAKDFGSTLDSQASAKARQTPDEGEPVTSVDDLRFAYKALEPAARTWVDAKRAESLAAHVDFHLSGGYTERRAGITSGLVTLAAHEADDDDSLRAIVRFVTDEDAAEWPTIPAGAAVGTLGAEEATLFAATCRAYVGGMLAFDFASGQPVLVEVKGS
jgi:hypothetical protein